MKKLTSLLCIACMALFVGCAGEDTADGPAADPGADYTAPEDAPGGDGMPADADPAGADPAGAADDTATE